MRDDSFILNPLFARPSETSPPPSQRLPEEPMLPETAYQIVHDEAMLDGNARLNLATFVTTWMDERANLLYSEALDKNIVDKDEYPQTAAIEERCWRMLAALWQAPDPAQALGCSTTGSSEACMLGGLALKRRWQEARRAQGKAADRPNLVMSSATQVCWEKFCNYFDVEPRSVSISEEHKVLDGAVLSNGRSLVDYLDENTIGVVAIMGVTYTGMYEPVAKIAAVLDDFQVRTGLDIPIHVDGASGAMVAPFLQPELVWDFRIPRVQSINTSGHKYGLVYPGVGWVVWREARSLPQSLIFNVSYLGGDMPTFALNFSRPGAQILLQYYNFLRFGFKGYQAIQKATSEVARYLAAGVGALEPFELWNAAEDIPVFAWQLAGGVERSWTLYDLSDRLRMQGWQIPAYPLPADLQEITVQRIVVRAGLSRDLADRLLDDIKKQVAWLERNGHEVEQPEVQRFHH
ncbi:MAG: glutamate decarboxylase [Coriobacteriales bacterium]|jgi:glutamate decarboxylase|nr:glutamate decarboxylase [Coriobacteriales bacterium]